MNRRQLITLLSGAAVPWPLAARAQQPDRVRRIGVLMTLAADDPEGQARVAAFRQGLQQLGWTGGHEVQIEIRWATSNIEARKHAAELVALAPDLILATGSPTVAALQQATRSVPIVFVNVADPVGAGFVDGLARPGGNITGFALYEYSMSGKFLELLKEIAPRVTRVGVLRDPAIAAGSGQLGVIQALAPSFGVELTPIGVRETGEIERGISAIAHGPNGGVIVTGSPLAVIHRELIIALAARHRLPAVYFYRFFVREGGLISYGPDSIDPYRRAAGYVDRILKGEKPANLPVQAPTKWFKLPVKCKMRWPAELPGSTGFVQSCASVSGSTAFLISSCSFSTSVINPDFTSVVISTLMVDLPSSGDVLQDSFDQFLTPGETCGKFDAVRHHHQHDLFLRRQLKQ